MIVIRNANTGERQIVASLDGVNSLAWIATAEAVPTDLESRAYQVIDDVLVAMPRWLTVPQAMALHTPTEVQRILSSENADVQRALMALNTLGGVGIGSIEHAQTVALFDIEGLLDDDTARPQRVLAGLPPQ